jgi:hypothetical protein
MFPPFHPPAPYIGGLAERMSTFRRSPKENGGGHSATDFFCPETGAAAPAENDESVIRRKFLKIPSPGRPCVPPPEATRPDTGKHASMGVRFGIDEKRGATQDADSSRSRHTLKRK